MARIAPVEKSPVMLRLANYFAKRRFGKEMDQVGIIAHNPGFLLPMSMMAGLASGKSEIPAETRQLAMHLVAEINGCNWCIDFGNKVALDMGVTVEKLVAVRDYAVSPLFSPAERAALACAEEMTRDGGHVSDATFDELRRHFSDRAIVELVVAVALENFYNRVNGALGIEEQGFCTVPLKPHSQTLSHEQAGVA